ncbi:MAG TPA: branched-chain amino acid aminotransferase [Phnomibacter sp.]|nr:branched-chain amino acid aminotransferase [Phnomibacter sp.]
MIASIDFKITRAQKSKLEDIVLENIPFGRVFTDHMLVAEYEGGEWKNFEIKPYQSLQVDPSNAAWHYGQSIFEGIKAYPMPDGEVTIFRPYDNFKRFNISAERMQMPQVPEELFIEGMRQLIEVDKQWVPQYPNHALYIRPFMFASDDAIGVRPSEKYLFIVILSPTGPYYAAPMRLYVEDTYVRAVQGGVGYAKTAGNYAASMYAMAKAKEKGYDQVLWTDAAEHKYVQEAGVMNVFFIIGNKAITPNLDGAILAGITRDSVITVLREMGIEVEERPIHIDELMEAYKNGELKEVFGAGTAATISMIKGLGFHGMDMHFDTNTWKISPAILDKLNAIRYGHEADTHEWLYKV